MALSHGGADGMAYLQTSWIGEVCVRRARRQSTPTTQIFKVTTVCCRGEVAPQRPSGERAGFSPGLPFPKAAAGRLSAGQTHGPFSVLRCHSSERQADCTQCAPRFTTVPQSTGDTNHALHFPAGLVMDKFSCSAARQNMSSSACLCPTELCSPPHSS